MLDSPPGRKPTESISNPTASADTAPTRATPAVAMMGLGGHAWLPARSRGANTCTAARQGDIPGAEFGDDSEQRPQLQRLWNVFGTELKPRVPGHDRKR